MVYVFKCPQGEVTFRAVDMPYNCGVAVIGYVRFSNNKKVLRNKFYMHLKTARVFSANLWPSDNRRMSTRVLLLSDKVGGVVYKFCKEQEMLEGECVTNVNSGNKIQVFEMIRDLEACR